MRKVDLAKQATTLLIAITITFFVIYAEYEDVPVVLRERRRPQTVRHRRRRVAGGDAATAPSSLPVPSQSDAASAILGSAGRLDKKG